MEEPTEQVENEEEQVPTRKVRKFRVIKNSTSVQQSITEVAPILEEEENKIPTKKRVIQIARKVPAVTQYDDPIKGSIEEDLMMEDNEDLSSFFNIEAFQAVEGNVTRYDSTGNVILFDESDLTPGSDGLNPDGTRRSPQKLATMLNRESGVGFSPLQTPESRLQAKLDMIEEGKMLEEERQKAYEATLPPGARILMNK